MGQTFGRDLSMAIGVQTDADAPFKTPAPADSYVAIPFYSHTLNRNQKLEQDDVLGEGRGRNPGDSTDGLVDHGGDLVVPFDLGNAGLWLRGLLGEPATTNNAGDYTHIFKSGAASLPAHTIEIKHKDDDYAQHIGMMVDKLSVAMAREGGYRKLTASLKGRTETSPSPTASAAGAIGAALTASKLVAVRGALKIDNVKVGEIISADAALANNLEAYAELDDGFVAGYDLGTFGFTGSLTARFLTRDMYERANAGTAFALELSWTLAANKSLAIRSGVTKLEKSAKPVSGPGGMQQQYNFVAQHDPNEVDKAMVVATLKNQIASYAIEVEE